jgi:hypothetical protein
MTPKLARRFFCLVRDISDPRVTDDLLNGRAP